MEQGKCLAVFFAFLLRAHVRSFKSYEHRLAKYYSKGFSPVFPSLSSSRSLDGEVRFGDFTAVQQVPHCEIAPLREGWWRVLVGDSRDAETTLAPNILKMRLVSDYGLEESMYSGPNLYAGGGEYNRRWAVRQGNGGFMAAISF